MYINKRRILRAIVYRFARFIPNDRRYLEILFPLRTGYPLNLEHPKTFNEKLQWLKLYNRRPEYTKMVDKVEAKKYVADIIGEEYIIPTLAVYDRAEDIDFEALPNQFVLKCTHDSGSILICKDKANLNRQSVIKKLNNVLKKNYFYQKREWPYKDVKPRIIAEKYLTDDGNELKDYKVFSFGGEPKFIEVDYNRFCGHKRNIYNTAWELLNFSIQYPSDSKRSIEKPPKIEEILWLSKKLSVGIPHIRIDFYIVNNQVFFGELTFFHESGMGIFSPIEWDLRFGELILLPGIG